jgi:hypothetical protein
MIMSTKNSIASAYLVKCSIGNVGVPGAPVANFALVVTPTSHKVSGQVYITQAVPGGNYSGPVHGTIYSSTAGELTQIVTLNGYIHQDTMPMEIPFSAHMGIAKDWQGTGGFEYANVHVEDAPLKLISQ